MTQAECKKYSKALAFAAQKHGEQRRKDNSPYIFHPIRVSMYLAEKGYDYRYQIAGLFHDLLEDTDATREELAVFCDEEMLEAIGLVTKTQGYVESEYIRAILQHPMAKAIKNADRIDNLLDLKHQQNEAFRERYLLNTEQFFKGKFSEELDHIYEDINGENKVTN